MKLLLIFIIIITLLLVPFIYYESLVIVEDETQYYIKTKFRNYKSYGPGQYFFPERVLRFFDSKAFTQHKIKTKPTPISENININLPSISLNVLGTDKVKLEYKILYKLSLSYNLTSKYQLTLIKNNISFNEKYTEIKDSIKTLDKDLVFKAINVELKKDEENIINIQNILENANEPFYQSLLDKYKKEDIEFSKNSILHSYESGPDLSLYKEIAKEAKRLQKEMLEKEANILLETNKLMLLEKRKKSLAQQDIERLKLYGELLKEYPSIIKFLYIEKLEKLKSIKIFENVIEHNLKQDNKESLKEYLQKMLDLNSQKLKTTNKESEINNSKSNQNQSKPEEETAPQKEETAPEVAPPKVEGSSSS